MKWLLTTLLLYAAPQCGPADPDGTAGPFTARDGPCVAKCWDPDSGECCTHYVRNVYQWARRKYDTTLFTCNGDVKHLTAACCIACGYSKCCPGDTCYDVGRIDDIEVVDGPVDTGEGPVLGK
jgi:hypothetical protein